MNVLTTTFLLPLCVWVVPCVSLNRGGTPRKEHVVFVGVPEETAVLPLKALALEMMARGYRASLALPQGFQSW